VVKFHTFSATLHIKNKCLIVSSFSPHIRHMSFSSIIPLHFRLSFVVKLYHNSPGTNLCRGGSFNLSQFLEHIFIISTPIILQFFICRFHRILFILFVYHTHVSYFFLSNEILPISDKKVITCGFSHSNHSLLQISSHPQLLSFHFP